MDNSEEARQVGEASFYSILAGTTPIVIADEALANVAEFSRHNWQILPLVYACLRQVKANSELNSLVGNVFVDEAVAIEVFSTVQLQALMEICEALATTKIRYALLKASAVRLECYQDPLHRTGWDIDIAVEICDLNRTKQLLEALGFYPAQFDTKTGRFAPADPVLRASVEQQHYELGFLVRRNRIFGLSEEQLTAIERHLSKSRHWHTDNEGSLCCYTCVDVHHGLSLDMPTSALLEHSRPIIWSGLEIWVPSLAWLGFHVIYKLYWEGVHAYGKGLYQYADLCRIVGLMDSSDVYQLIKLLDGSNLRAAAFYVLRRLPTVFGVDLQEEIRDYLESCAIPENDDPLMCNDLGDMWEKLWNRR
jgi:Uncharacterised nucleotidyltransferase